MLPEIHLDTDTFEDIVKKARGQISEIYADWTDYNLHDPGITMLELFAFLKEAQQYTMDQVDERILRKFLKLIGISLQLRQPAKTVGILECDSQVHLPCGMKFWNDDICFETTKDFWIPPYPVKGWIAYGKQGEVSVRELTENREESYARFYPFGKRNGEGKFFDLCLKTPLTAGNSYYMTVELHKNANVQRNVLRHLDKFVPLSKIACYYFGENGYQPLAVKDTTVGFLQNGTISFVLPEEMALTAEEGIEGYFLRFALEEDAFDTMPVLQAVHFCKIPLEQRDTKAAFLPVLQAEQWGSMDTQKIYFAKKGEYYVISKPQQAEMAAVYTADFHQKCLLAEGNGFPNQTYPFAEAGILSDSVEILVESIMEEGYFRKWTKVLDFSASTPEDCHYIVDEEKNVIQFGDGIHGRVPETKIWLVSCAFCAEEKGNLKSDIPLMTSEKDKQISLYLAEDARGGKKPETIWQGFWRADEIFQNEGRMVSSMDFERAVMQTPGLQIRKCKVLDMNDIRYENEVHLVVQPYGEERKPMLSQAYCQNIYNHLEGKRLIGSSVKLYSPEYIELEIYIEVLSKPQFRQTKEAVEKTVRAFLEQFDDFGTIIRYGALFAAIESMQEVVEVRTLTLMANNNRVMRDKNGDLHFPPLGVLLIHKLTCAAVY